MKYGCFNRTILTAFARFGLSEASGGSTNIQADTRDLMPAADLRERRQT